jgi:hypothetical protein
MILIGYKRHKTTKRQKADKEISYKCYQGRKDEIIDKGISVVF